MLDYLSKLPTRTNPPGTVLLKRLEQKSIVHFQSNFPLSRLHLLFLLALRLPISPPRQTKRRRRTHGGVDGALEVLGLLVGVGGELGELGLLVRDRIVQVAQVLHLTTKVVESLEEKE